MINREFKQVYSKGRSVANRLLVLYVRPNNYSENRLGISVSKKIGNAVVRNRIKRLIREAYRALRPFTETGYDLVVVARVSAGSLPRGEAYKKIDESLRLLLKRHQLLREEGV